jgi:hypothetical protein
MNGSVNPPLGALYHLVHDISAHQYFVEIYTQRISKPYYTDNRSIWLCITVVPHLRVLGFDIPQPEDSYPGFEEWYQISIQGDHFYRYAFGRLSASWSSSQLDSHIQNACVVGAYHQGTISTLYCTGISGCLPNSIRTRNLSVTRAVDYRGDAGMFDRLLR